jgi:cell division transport system permease protein
MFWVNIKRIIRAGFMNFSRNGFVSLATVLIMTVTLFAIGSVIFIIIGLNASLAEIKSKVDISVYFTVGADENSVLAVKKSLEALPSVEKVTYISQDQALQNFKTRHEGDSLTLQALDELGSNPLGAILNIQAKDPSQYEAIADFLKPDSALPAEAASIIDRINYFDNKAAIEKLAKIIQAAEQLGFVLSLILIVISIIIAFNTIRLAIFISRDEISVMRLVGASNKYIRGPFVVSGILYGLVAGLLTMAIFYPLTRYVGQATASFFSGVNFFSYYTGNFGQFFLLIVGSGAVLGAISSYLAVRRYLKI